MFIEQIVKKTNTRIIKKVKIILAVLLVCPIILVPIYVISSLGTVQFEYIAMILICFLIYVLLYIRINRKIEYEYVLLDDDFEISCIYNKSSRKKIVNINLNQIIKLYPQGESLSERYSKYSIEKKYDFSGIGSEFKNYILLYKNNDQKYIEILFSPKEELSKAMSRIF